MQNYFILKFIRRHCEKADDHRLPKQSLEIASLRLAMIIVRFGK